MVILIKIFNKKYNIFSYKIKRNFIKIYVVDLICLVDGRVIYLIYNSVINKINI